MKHLPKGIYTVSVTEEATIYYIGTHEVLVWWHNGKWEYSEYDSRNREIFYENSEGLLRENICSQCGRKK